jgi:CNT family concentrative nucleoside transporter
MSFGFLQPLLGSVLLIALAVLLSENRRAIRPRFVLAALGLQLAFALLLLRVPLLRDGLFALNGLVGALQTASNAATSFVFGYIGGAPPPFAIENPQGMVVLAFGILPILLVISALAALFWYWGILPRLTRAFAFLLERTLGVGGAVGLCAAATPFLGMVEAPLLIRPYLARLSRAELFAILAVGLSTVSGTVLFLYASFLSGRVPDALGHILVASILNVPSSFLFSHLLIPGAEVTKADAAQPKLYRSSIDSIVQGTEDGLKLYLNIIAMLVVSVALVKLADLTLAVLPQVAGAPLSFERMAGWAFAPLVWCVGVPWSEAPAAGALMGTKTVLNELLAYLALGGEPGTALSPHTRLLMLYALCGFANFGSVGIMIGGVSAMAPERRGELGGLSLKSMIPGTLATLLTAAIAGLFVP